MEPSWHQDSGFNIELTSICNLKCPLCARTMFPEMLKPVSLRLEFIRKVFTPSLIRRHECFRFIGSHGDPIFHPNLHEVLLHFKNHSAKKLILNTNGSGRPREWWNRVGEILTKEDTVVFSIDGLEDTNPVYRVNSNWKDIEDAVAATAGKMKIGWKFIVFRHNEGQIAQAVARAKEMGFDWISFESSIRWNPGHLPSNPEIQRVAQALKPSESFVTGEQQVVPGIWPGDYRIMNRVSMTLRESHG